LLNGCKNRLFSPCRFAACPLSAIFFWRLDLIRSLIIWKPAFTDSDINYLATLPIFKSDFLDYLRHFRFTGNLLCPAGGNAFFVDEPILEVEAPLPQAQLIETFVMNQIHIQTLLATKAQRVVEAAKGRPVVDFSARRIHGTDAAIKGARAFYIGGVNATSNVMAGKQYGISVAGTVAHAYIQSHPTEADAFRAFTKVYPKTMLLVDTYDTLKGVQKVIDLAGELGDDFKVTAVRLDSGDLLSLSIQTRKLLDQAGLKQVQIFASGGLDEYRIEKLVSSGAPIDGFGVGTAMGVSSDVPSLDIGYKLVQYAGKGRLKLVTAKTVLPAENRYFAYLIRVRISSMSLPGLMRNLRAIPCLNPFCEAEFAFMMLRSVW